MKLTSQYYHLWVYVHSLNVNPVSNTVIQIFGLYMQDFVSVHLCMFVFSMFV